ncbi:hypothetical protein [Nocardia paucivorans]|uniref:hypothetical protein n=1 Tax=Nocardia paucivorans TaxID=114259 RepID=UPI0012FC2100|nr:hypothetical protein [Nocardia paucivorans]
MSEEFDTGHMLWEVVSPGTEAITSRRRLSDHPILHRMVTVGDPPSEELAESFAGQWLISTQQEDAGYGHVDGSSVSTVPVSTVFR